MTLIRHIFMIHKFRREMRVEQGKLEIFASKVGKKKGFIVRKDIEENLNVSQAAAVILLRGLVERQVLIKQGKARNTRYYLKNKQD